MRRKQTQHLDSNKSILGIAYVFVGLFLCLLVYFGYFLQVRSQTGDQQFVQCASRQFCGPDCARRDFEQ